VVNAWAYPAFREAVIATGRKHLIMAGVTTDVCLIFPAIDAALEGFAVQTVMDASGSPDWKLKICTGATMRDVHLLWRRPVRRRETYLDLAQHHVAEAEARVAR
jgi:nicotinamidase-related amidase